MEAADASRAEAAVVEEAEATPTVAGLEGESPRTVSVERRSDLGELCELASMVTDAATGPDEERRAPFGSFQVLTDLLFFCCSSRWLYRELPEEIAERAPAAVECLVETFNDLKAELGLELDLERYNTMTEKVHGIYDAARQKGAGRRVPPSGRGANSRACAPTSTTSTSRDLRRPASRIYSRKFFVCRS